MIFPFILLFFSTSELIETRLFLFLNMFYSGFEDDKYHELKEVKLFSLTQLCNFCCVCRKSITLCNCLCFCLFLSFFFSFFCQPCPGLRNFKSLFLILKISQNGGLRQWVQLFRKYQCKNWYRNWYLHFHKTYDC